MSRNDLRERIESEPDRTPFWEHKPGAVLVGMVVGIDMRSTMHDPAVPVVTIEDEDTGNHVAVWATLTVLRDELKRARPRIGERIAIRRLEDSEKGYKRFRLLVDRDHPQSFDWDSVSTDGGDIDPRDRDELVGRRSEPPRRSRPRTNDDYDERRYPAAPVDRQRDERPSRQPRPEDVEVFERRREPPRRSQRYDEHDDFPPPADDDLPF